MELRLSWCWNSHPPEWQSNINESRENVWLTKKASFVPILMTFGHACHDSGDTREPMPFHKADVCLSWWRPGGTLKVSKIKPFRRIVADKQLCERHGELSTCYTPFRSVFAGLLPD
ncbi:hypothetical protein F2P79_010622 [Pimephales promelas]|nr:hypothetical protein F2P79_010622 [Pimephales promelas]